MSLVSGIQIIGTQRSGSNLLRVILDQSPEIASPHPPHILVTFIPLLRFYEDVSQSYETLVSDVVDYVNANPVVWEGIHLNKEDLVGQSKKRDLFELNRLIYEAAALQKKATYWCCKSMANVHFADELEVAIPNLKYIYLYRDGRDVATSFKKAVVGEKHIYHIAKQWQHDQEACIRLSGQIPKDRFITLNYESLLEDPEESIKRVCNFLKINYREDMLGFYNSAESRNTAEAGAMWANLKKPIIKDNVGKFKSYLTETDIEIFETVAGSTLQKLGYALTTPGNATDLLTATYTHIFDLENARLKKKALADADQKDLDNRKAQLEIINKIKGR